MADRYMTLDKADNVGLVHELTERSSGGTTYYRLSFADAAAEGNPDSGTSVYMTLNEAANRALPMRFVDRTTHHELEIVFV